MARGVPSKGFRMTAKRKAKGHAILRASNAAKSNEPIINEENYNVSIS